MMITRMLLSYEQHASGWRIWVLNHRTIHGFRGFVTWDISYMTLAFSHNF